MGGEVGLFSGDPAAWRRGGPVSGFSSGLAEGSPYCFPLAEAGSGSCGADRIAGQQPFRVSSEGAGFKRRVELGEGARNYCPTVTGLPSLARLFPSPQPPFPSGQPHSLQLPAEA